MSYVIVALVFAVAGGVGVWLKKDAIKAWIAATF